jgi:cytochrome c biogenesis protein CcdA/glutaredoxin
MRISWNRASRYFAGALVVMLALASSLHIVSAANSVVSFYFFYSTECDHCTTIQGEVLAPLLAQYGDQVDIHYREIADPAVFKQLVALEKEYDVPAEEAAIPTVFLDQHALIGEQITASLAHLVEQYLAEGGADLPAIPRLAAAQTKEPVVRFYLFYSETCPHCHEVMDNYLPTVYEKYGDQVEYEYIDIYGDNDEYLTLLGVEKKLGMPEDRQGSVPALVIGDKVLIGSAEIPDQLEGLIEGYLAEGGVDFVSLDDLPEIVLPTPAPAVQVLVFFDQSHPQFARMQSFVVGLGQKHGNSFQLYGVDTSQAENADRLAQLNAALGGGTPAPGTPEVLIDRQLLVGMDEIEAVLPGLIDGYLAQGGVTVPSWEELISGGATEDITPTPKPTDAGPNLIHIAYFEQAGCQECARTTYDLRLVQDAYPQVEVESFSIEDPDNKALNEWLSEVHGVPEEKRLSTPMLFIGQEFLIGESVTLDNILAAVTAYAETGADRTWDDYDPQQAEQSLVDRFMSFGVLTVLGAGLIDGLNPCAFATLVFFISYLTFTGRRGRDVLFVGISFALGVFLTYLLVGVGLLKVIQSLSFFTALGRWVYLLTAVLCAVLAVLTFRDFFEARRGNVSEMTLKLPISLRRRINAVIREGAQVHAFVAMAFVTGFVVSLIELACTGQVYLPTIVYVMSRPELAAEAFLYLVLYCLMFIVPLVVVFILSYFGTTSEQFGSFINRHTSTIKFITGLVFVGLTLWMTWALAPLFGVHPPATWVLMVGLVLVIALAVVVWLVTDKRAPEESTPRRRRRRRST